MTFDPVLGHEQGGCDPAVKSLSVTRLRRRIGVVDPATVE